MRSPSWLQSQTGINKKSVPPSVVTAWVCCHLQNLMLSCRDRMVTPHATPQMLHPGSVWEGAGPVGVL